MVKVFIAYVRLILEYVSQVWSLSTIDLINRIQCVQRLFTKRIRSAANLLYNKRLSKLGLQRLEIRRMYLNVLF